MVVRYNIFETKERNMAYHYIESNVNLCKKGELETLSSNIFHMTPDELQELVNHSEFNVNTWGDRYGSIIHNFVAISGSIKDDAQLEKFKILLGATSTEILQKPAVNNPNSNLLHSIVGSSSPAEISDVLDALHQKIGPDAFEKLVFAQAGSYKHSSLHEAFYSSGNFRDNTNLALNKMLELITPANALKFVQEACKERPEPQSSWYKEAKKLMEVVGTEIVLKYLNKTFTKTEENGAFTFSGDIRLDDATRSGLKSAGNIYQKFPEFFKGKFDIHLENAFNNVIADNLLFLTGICKEIQPQDKSRDCPLLLPQEVLHQIFDYCKISDVDTMGTTGDGIATE
jgi:hypothetical protein